IARVEIRHSNFLAFILDPAESHGQGQLFLKAILMDLLKETAAELRPLSPIELDGTDLRGVRAERQWEHLDLLIECKDPRFLVVVENKMKSGDHTEQLNRSQETMRRLYPADGNRPLFVYLPPDTDDSPDNTEGWVAYRYEDIHGVLTRVRNAHEHAI